MYVAIVFLQVLIINGINRFSQWMLSICTYLICKITLRIISRFTMVYNILIDLDFIQNANVIYLDSLVVLTNVIKKSTSELLWNIFNRLVTVVWL